MYSSCSAVCVAHEQKRKFVFKTWTGALSFIHSSIGNPRYHSIAYHPSHKLYLHFAKKERIIDYFRELTTINNCDRRYSILYQTSCIEYAFTVFFHGLSIAFKNVGSKNRWNNGFPLLFSIKSFDMDMNARNVRLMKTFARENGCHINDF